MVGTPPLTQTTPKSQPSVFPKKKYLRRSITCWLIGCGGEWWVALSLGCCSKEAKAGKVLEEPSTNNMESMEDLPAGICPEVQD